MASQSPDARGARATASMPAWVTREDSSYLVNKNESTFIPLGNKYRLENPGRVPLEMIDVQSDSHLGEGEICGR